MNTLKLRRLTLAALFGAVSFILMYFGFSVPMLSPFASFDFSALPELIGGFILGPVGAVGIIIAVQATPTALLRAVRSAPARASAAPSP